MSEKEACCVCRFWDVWDMEVHSCGYGSCRRYPAPEGKFGGDWCGEFRRRDREPTDTLDAVFSIEMG